MAELIQNQLDEASGCVDIDVADREVAEDDVVWTDDEVPTVTRVKIVRKPKPRRGPGRPRKRPISASATPVATPAAETPVPNGDDAEDQPEDDTAEKAEVDEEAEEEVEAEDEEEEEEVQKVWQEPDCRIVVNVSLARWHR